MALLVRGVMVSVSHLKKMNHFPRWPTIAGACDFVLIKIITAVSIKDVTQTKVTAIHCRARGLFTENLPIDSACRRKLQHVDTRAFVSVVEKLPQSGDVRTFPRLLHTIFRLCARERVEKYDEEYDGKRSSDVHGPAATRNAAIN